jgi:hypothetical protein
MLETFINLRFIVGIEKIEQSQQIHLQLLIILITHEISMIKIIIKHPL